MAVTNRRLCGRPFLEQIERVCALRPAAVILREKDLTPEEYGRLGAQVLEVCRAWGVDCIYHSFVEEARKAGVRRIHLPLARLEALAKGGTTGGASLSRIFPWPCPGNGIGWILGAIVQKKSARILRTI